MWGLNLSVEQYYKSVFMEYYYQLYGVIVKTNFCLFTPRQMSNYLGKVDIDISLHQPVSLAECSSQGYIKKRGQSILLSIVDVAIFKIVAGKKITIHPFCVRYDQKEIELYLLGSAFSIVLHQRKLSVFHANAIVASNQRVLLFAGESGAGKSTLAAAFCQKGYQYLTDDVSVLYQQDIHWWVAPAYPYIKLWDNSLQFFAMHKRNHIPVINRENKFYVNFHEQFCSCPGLVSGMFMLNRSQAVDNPCLVKLSGLQAYQLYLKNIYRIQFLSALGLLTQQFHTISKLARDVPCFRLDVPHSLSPQNIVTWMETHNYV